jgi:hypothetical protein
MIEVYDIKDAEPEKLDITPELALAAYNTLIQFCKQQEASDDGTCNQCILYKNCSAITDSLPEEWEELHYPKLVDNSVFYLKDGKVREIVHANRQEAEETFKEMVKNGF